MAEKSQVLKSYEIEITAKIDKAEEQLKTLEQRIDKILEGSGKSKNSAIAKAMSDQFDALTSSIATLSKTTQKQIDDMNKSFGKLGVKTLEKKYKELANSLDAALGRVSGEMLDLRNVIDKTDSSNFSNFVNELKVPLENLTNVISQATAEFQKLPAALSGLKGVDSVLQNTAKSEDDIANKGQRLVELLDELNNIGKTNKSNNILTLLENGFDDLDLRTLNQLQNAIAAIEDEIKRLKNDGINVSDILFENSIVSKNVLNKIKSSVNQTIADITGDIQNSKESKKLSDAEISITVHPDFDEKEVTTFLETVQKKLNEHADKFPVKIPLGYKIDTSDLDEETAKEVQEKAAKNLKSGLMVGMRANQDDLLQSTKEAIEYVNKELNVYDNAIEVKVKPIDIDKSALNNISLDVENKATEEVIVKSQNGISISDTGNLATEDTLSSIRDILLGVKTEIKSTDEQSVGSIDDKGDISDQIVHGRLRTRQFSLNPTNYASDVAEIAGDLMNELSELYQIQDDLKVEISALRNKNEFDEVKNTSLYSASSVGGDGRIYSALNKGQLLDSSQKSMEVAFNNYSKKIKETTNEINEKYSDALKDEENSWKKYATEQLTYNYEYGKSQSSETGLRQNTTDWIKSTSEFTENLRQAQLSVSDDLAKSKNDIKTAKTNLTKTINKLIKNGKIGEDIAEVFKESHRQYIDFFQNEDITISDTKENYEIKSAKQKFLETIALANHTTVDSEMQKAISQFETAVNTARDTVKSKVDVNKIIKNTYDQIYHNNLKLIEDATSIDTDINYKQLSKDKDGKLKQTTIESLFKESKGKEIKNSINSIIEPLIQRQNNVEKEIKNVTNKLALNNVSVKNGTTNVNASDLSALNSEEIANSVFKQVDAINQKYKQRIEENEQEQAYLLREKQICEELLALQNDELSATISEEEKQERINALLKETKELKSGSLNPKDYVNSKSAAKIIADINSISSSFDTAKTPGAIKHLQEDLAKSEAKLKALAIKDIADVASYATKRLAQIGKPYEEVKSEYSQLVIGKNIPNDKYTPDAMTEVGQKKLLRRLIKKAGIGELASLQRETLLLGSQANKEKNALIIGSQSGVTGGTGEKDTTVAIKNQKEYNEALSEFISLKKKLSDIGSKIKYTDEWSLYQDLANKYAKGVTFTEEEVSQYERLKKKSERRGLDPVSKNKQDWSLLTPAERSFYQKNTGKNNRLSSLSKKIALYEKTNDVENPYFKTDKGVVTQAKNLKQIGIYSKEATEAYNDLYLASDKSFSLSDKIEKYNTIIKDTDATIQSLGINGKETSDFISAATKQLDKEIVTLKDELAKQEDLKIKNRDEGKSTSKQNTRIAELKEDIALKSGSVLDSEELNKANSELKETKDLITLLISDIALASDKSDAFVDDFKNIEINYNKSKSDFDEVKQIFEHNFADAWQRMVGQWKPGQFSKQQLSEFEKELRQKEKSAIGYNEAEAAYKSDRKKYYENNNILANAGKYSRPLQKALEKQERLETQIDYLQGEQNKKANIRNGLINLYAEQIEKEYTTVVNTNKKAKEQVEILKKQKQEQEAIKKAEDEKLNYDVNSARTKENRSYNGKTAVVKGQIKSLNSEIENIQNKIEENLKTKQSELTKQTELAMDKILPILGEKVPDSLQVESLDYPSVISAVERYNNELYSGSNRPSQDVLTKQIDELYKTELEKNTEYQEIKQRLSENLQTIRNLTKNRKTNTTTKSAKKDAKKVEQSRNEQKDLIARRDELETSTYKNAKSSILSKWDGNQAESLINIETQYLVLTDRELEQQEKLNSVGQISLSEHQQNIIAINNENKLLEEQLRTLKKQKEEKESQLAIKNKEHLQNLSDIDDIEKYQQDKATVNEVAKKRKEFSATKKDDEKFTVANFDALVKNDKVEEATKSLSEYVSKLKSDIANLEESLIPYQHELSADSKQSKFIKSLEQEGALSDEASDSLKQTYILAKKALDNITNKVNPIIASINSQIDSKRNEIRALQSAEQNYYEKNTYKANRAETDLEKYKKEKDKTSSDEYKYIKYAGMTEEEVAISKQIGGLAKKLNAQKQKGVELDQEDLSTYNKLVETAKEIYGLTIKAPKSKGWFTGVRSKYSKDEVLANKAKFNTNSETAKALGLSSISNLSASSEGVVINATKSGLALNSTVREIVDILKNGNLGISDNNKTKTKYNKNSDYDFLKYAGLTEEQAQIKHDLGKVASKLVNQKKKGNTSSTEDLNLYKNLREKAKNAGLQLKSDKRGFAGAYQYAFSHDKKDEVLANKSKYNTNSFTKKALENTSSSSYSKKKKQSNTKQKDNSDEKFLEYANLTEEQAQVKKELNSLISKMISQKKKEGKYSEENLATYQKLRQKASDEGLRLKKEQKGRLAGVYKYGFDYDKKDEVLANKSKYATNSIAKDLLDNKSSKNKKENTDESKKKVNVVKENIEEIKKETDIVKENTEAKKENGSVDGDNSNEINAIETDVEVLANKFDTVKDTAKALVQMAENLIKVKSALKELGAFDSNFKTVDEYIKASNISIEDLINSVSKISGLKTETISDIFDNFTDIFTNEDDVENLSNTLKEDIEKVVQKVEVSNQQNSLSDTKNSSEVSIENKADDVISDAQKIDDALAQLGKESSQSIKAFIASIGESEDDLVAEISMLANIPEETVRNILDIHSPSVVMQQLGYWTGKGFAGGVNKSEDDVQQAITDLMTAFKADAQKQSKTLEEYLQEAFNEVWTNAPTVTRGQLGGKALRQIFENNGLLESKSSTQTDSAPLTEEEKINADAKAKETKEVTKLKNAYAELTKVYKIYYKALTKNPDEYKEIDKKAIAKYNNNKAIVDALMAEYSSNEDVQKALEKYLENKAKVESDFETKQDNSLNKQLSKLQPLSNEDNYISKYVSDVNVLIERIQELQKNGFDLTNADDQKKIQDITTEYLRLINLQNDKSVLKGKEVSIEKLEGDLVKLKKYTALPKEIKDEVDKLYDSLLKMKDGGDYSVQDIANLATDIEKVKNSVEASGKKAVSFVDQIKQRLQDMNSKYIAQFFSFQDWIRYGREVINIITEIDSAMTELRKVSNATETELNQALAQATTTAKELGANISDIVSLQADWSRLGYSVEEAEELARVTQLYVNVGDNLTTDTASEYMISTLQGFNIEAENAIEIVDKFNEVANNFAIDTEGLGDALERSAASFTASGTSLSEAIAIVTTANTVVQDSEKVGTAMKTLSARIRGASTELEDLGEEEDAYTKSTSKLRKEVLALTGFDIMEDETTYKSIYEILLGIGQEWDNLTDVEQASLGEALAGKQNSNVFYSIMQNIDDLQDVYETAENAAGSAEKEELSYEKSIEYSLDRIKASAQEWANDLISSDVIKWFVDLANAIVNVSTKFTALGTVIAGAGIFAGVKNFKSLKTSMESYSSVLQMLSMNGLDSKNVKNLGGLSADSVTNLANSLKGLNEQQANLVLSTTSLDAESKNYLLTCAGIKAANIEQIAQNGTLTKSILTNNLARVTATKEEAASLVTKMQEAGVIKILENGTVRLTEATLQEAIAESALSKVDKERITNALLQQTANEGLTASYSKLAKAQLKAMFANPATWIMLAAGAAVIGYKAVGYFTLSTEEAAEGAEKLADSVKTLKKETSENLSTINDLNKRYQELSKGVNSVGENVSLTTTEYEEYKDIMSQIAEIMPDLNYYYDEQGEAIGLVGEQLDDLSEKYKEVAKEQAQTQLAEKDDENNLLTTVSEQNYKNFEDASYYVENDNAVGENYVQTSYTRQQVLDMLKNKDVVGRDYLESIVGWVTNFTSDEIAKASDDEFDNMVNEAISTLESDLASRFSEFKDGYITNQILADEKYWDLDDDVRGNIDKLVSSLSSETWEALKSASGAESVSGVTDWLIDQFSDKDLQQAWTDLTDLDLSDVQFGDIDSTLQEKAKTIFEALGLDWDNGGYELLVSLNLVPDETNYNALKDMLGENGDLADGLTVGQIDTLTSDDFQEWAKDAEINISEVAGSYRNELIDAAQEVLDEERQKAKDWSEEVPGLYEKVYDEQGNYILKQSQFGNVDMDKREIITWTRELKKQYADALASWDYDPEIGSIDTVFGNWGEFGDERLPISFTPILVDENGENAQFLDSNTVYNYINDLVEQSTKNGKIDTDLLLQLDADRENGGWGLISGVGDEAEMISTLTHFAGLFGAEQIAMEDMQEAASDDGWAKKLVNAYKIAQKGTEKLSDSLSTITTEMDGLSSLGDIYKDVQDKGEFDYSSIADTDGDFYKAFGGLGQTYEDFLQTVADSPSNISACQQAFNNLATTWVYANGVLDDLDNTNKQATANMLKQNGIQNATEMVNAYISAANTYTQAYNSLDGATDKAISLADATWEDIETMAQVPEVTQEAADAMYIYYIQKLMASSGFTSASDIQELANVIQALGIAGTAWGKYYSARANYQALSNVDLSDGESKTVSLVNLKTGKAYEKEIKSQKQLNHYLEYQNNIMNSNKSEGLDQMAQKVGNLGATVKKTADDTSSDAKDKADEIEDAYENLLDAETTVLEKQLDAQLITYSDYLDKRLALLEDYHNKGLISEEKYYEGLADTYQSEIDNYDKVISAVDKVIDDKVKALEKQKDALEDANDVQVKALEKQQDALEKQKEELEDQKEALEDANDAREDAIELQKALYDLQKAQSQKSKLV